MCMSILNDIIIYYNNHQIRYFIISILTVYAKISKTSNIIV